MAENERNWVIEPRTARIDIAIGPEADLSPELRAALEDVARALGEESDVQGHMMKVDWECSKVSITQCALLIQCSDVGYSQ